MLMSLGRVRASVSEVWGLYCDLILLQDQDIITKVSKKMQKTVSVGAATDNC